MGIKDAKVNYLKDTKEFWQNRKIARKKLDAKRSSVSFSQKVAVVGKLADDAKFLRTGRVVSAKAPVKPAKT
jgi:hypothetical protein